jgi:hypothetical protein
MTQLTIRFDRALEGRLRALAKRERISLNQAAVRLLRKGAGLEDAPPAAADCIGNTLDDLIGTWSADEATELAAAVAIFETIDEELWQRR